jgi:H2-forming N5,N10-methylenetetrahydromethanopterin dehydrogenase-like enzyme
VDDLVEQVETLEAELNSSTEKNIAQNEEVNSLRKTMIIREASKDLAETQVEKLLSLADNVDYEGEDDFAAKVETLKGSYFSEKVEDAIEASSITEDTINEINEDPAEETQEVSSMMEKYLTAIRSSN